MDGQPLECRHIRNSPRFEHVSLSLDSASPVWKFRGKNRTTVTYLNVWLAAPQGNGETETPLSPKIPSLLTPLHLNKTRVVSQSYSAVSRGKHYRDYNATGGRVENYLRSSRVVQWLRKIYFLGKETFHSVGDIFSPNLPVHSHPSKSTLCSALSS